MENSTRKFYTNLILGSVSLLGFYITYQFSTVVLEGKNYVASVNGTRFITAHELKEKIGAVKGQYASQMGLDYKSEKGKEGYDTLRKQLLQEMILTKIMLGNAEQEKILVNNNMVIQEITKIKAQNFQNSDLAFKSALRKNNIKEENLPAMLKEKMTLQKYVEKLMLDNIKLTDKDLKDYYDSKKSEYVVKESVEASHILVKSEADAQKIYKEMIDGFAAGIHRPIDVDGEDLFPTVI